MTTWSKTPPSEPGWYWFRYPSAVRVWQEPFAYLHMAGSSASDQRAEYGPRIPSPEAIEEVKRVLRAAEPCLRADNWRGVADSVLSALAKLEGR